MKTTKLKLLLAMSMLTLFFLATAKAQTTALVQSFDTTTAGFLPLGWASTQTTGTGINWAVSNTSPNSPPHAVYGNEPPTVNATALVSPTFTVNSPAATLRFKTNYSLESATAVGFDGMVLEIKIGANIPTDIVAAGGTFLSGDYTHTISSEFGNPLAGRRAWSGNSGGYITCTVRLPAFANGQTVQLRWVIGTDDTVGGAGARIDDIQVANGNFYMAPFDFDGDFKTDIGIFRPAAAEWWINRSSNGQTFATQFGSSTDILTPGDFTGDGKTDIAFWRPSTGFWYVLRSESFSFYSFPFGAGGDIPAPADFDGDGRTDAAVFRPPTATWFISRSSGGTTITAFGAPQDQPVPADYDGDSRADIAIYRPSVGEWWLQRSTVGPVTVQFGASGDRALPGDFTGDRQADVAFWRPSTGFWYVLRSENFSFFSFPFGATGDLPAPGDYDGDGKIDAGVFRPSTATWFVNRSTAGIMIVGFGTPNDVPVPTAFVR